MATTQQNRLTALLDVLRICGGWTTQARERLVDGLYIEDAIVRAQHEVDSMGLHSRASNMDTPKFEEGKWYCVGWDNDDGSVSWDVLIRYEGYGTFSGDDGNIVNELFDPALQCCVAVDAADHYQLQA